MSVVEVVPAANEWQILIDGCPGRRYSFKEKAKEAAERYAERRQAELRVKREDNSIEWQTAQFTTSPGY